MENLKKEMNTGRHNGLMKLLSVVATLLLAVFCFKVAPAHAEVDGARHKNGQSPTSKQIERKITIKPKTLTEKEPGTKNKNDGVSKKEKAFLLNEYFKKRLGIGTKSLFPTQLKADKKRANLTEQETIIYRKLQKRIFDIAKGTEESSVVDFSLTELGLKLSYSAKDLGVERIIGEDGKTVTEAARNAINRKLNVRPQQLIWTMLADMPFELYWFDKTAGISYKPPAMAAVKSGENEFITFEKNAKLVFSMKVSEEYGHNYTVDRTITSKAYKASENAKQIVEKYRSKTDIEKLEAYRDEILGLVEYDYNAVTKYENDKIYGNPWQVIHVFDDDPKTNVVCEGYSKAFQYLCDMTTFNDGGIACASVSGDMDSDLGSGPHMWNNVSIDGKTYLTDLTSADSSPEFFGNKLFLAGVAGSVTGGYRFDSGKHHISYLYDQPTRYTFTDSYLTLSEKSYYEDLKDKQNRPRPDSGSSENLEKKTDVGNTGNGNTKAGGATGKSKNGQRAYVGNAPGKVKILKIKNKGRKRIIRWNSVKNADGYLIQIKKRSWKTLKTLKSGKAVIRKVFRILRKSGNKKYKYRVRAFVIYKGEKIYGKWSKVVSV